MTEKIPDANDVKLIYRDTYLLYTNHKDIQTVADFQLLMDAAHKLQNNYPFKIAEKMIAEVIDVIEQQWASRNS